MTLPDDAFSPTSFQPQTFVGWDVGGAHLKLALIDQQGAALQVLQLACPLWRGMAVLSDTLDEALATLSIPSAQHAVTMTGELADIFPDRLSGVYEIADLLSQKLPGRVSFYAGQQRLVPIADVAYHAKAIASANWMASAAFISHRIAQALLVDVGSTTTDIVTIADGQLNALGLTDAERLAHYELVYTGVVRTPLMAVCRQLPFAGQWVNVAAEHFATTADVYRLTAELNPDDDASDTADGAGKTVEESARRLARMVGADLADADMACWLQLAQACKQQQLTALTEALLCVLSRGLLMADVPLVGAGAGRFLVKMLADRLERPYLDVSDLILGNAETKHWASVCFPAYAVANLMMHNSR